MGRSGAALGLRLIAALRQLLPGRSNRQGAEPGRSVEPRLFGGSVHYLKLLWLEAEDYRFCVLPGSVYHASNVRPKDTHSQIFVLDLWMSCGYPLAIEFVMDAPTSTPTAPACRTCGGRTIGWGRDRRGNVRHRCKACGSTYGDIPPRPLGAMRIDPARATLCMSLLTEGCSIRSTERVSGVHRDTITKLLLLAGRKAEALLDKLVHRVEVKDVQADEIWGYVAMKEKTKTKAGIADPKIGDAYTFVGFERQSKVVLAWHLGRRTSEDTHRFMTKLDCATSGRFQLTTDGFDAYPAAVEEHGSAHLTSSGRTLRCGCSSGGSRGLRMAFRRSGRTYRRRWPCTSGTTIFAGFTLRSAARQRWRPVSRGSRYGWRICWRPKARLPIVPKTPLQRSSLVVVTPVFLNVGEVVQVKATATRNPIFASAG
jgi:IS1 family transposase/transposase-like protein